MDENERMLMVYHPMYGRLWFYASEVRQARSDTGVLMCGRTARGQKTYDMVMAKRVSRETKGLAFITEMRRASGVAEGAVIPKEESPQKKGNQSRARA